MLESMDAMCCFVIWSKIRVRAAAGVMQSIAMSRAACSLPSDTASAITPAFEAEWAAALGFPSLAAIGAMSTTRP